MTSILLEIKNPNDWQVLKPLLERLKIHFKPVESAPAPQKISREKALEIINAGLPAFENFEGWMEEFEESREDRVLPFREH